MTEPADRKPERLPFGGVNPILRVRDVHASIDHYTKVLGFELLWIREESAFACVARGKCHLFLSEGDQGHLGTWVWIGVSDVERVFAEFQVAGATVRNPPTNYPWALEMQVEDPNGNVLCIGSDCKADEPWGEWLDMNGNRWALTEDNKWVRAEAAANT